MTKASSREETESGSRLKKQSSPRQSHRHWMEEAASCEAESREFMTDNPSGRNAVQIQIGEGRTKLEIGDKLRDQKFRRGTHLHQLKQNLRVGEHRDRFGGE
ncbi:hypothetical protein C8R45DRAFT_938803 [Mycena sanguinolenta]|nr:hypothetical protein C8R45DRAFT_938803 [Mycena sanguinolenta]